MKPHPRVAVLRKQERSRAALRRAITAYAALRGAPGPYADEFPVTLRDGTPATATLNLTLTPQEPTA